MNHCGQERQERDRHPEIPDQDQGVVWRKVLLSHHLNDVVDASEKQEADDRNRNRDPGRVALGIGVKTANPETEADRREFVLKPVGLPPNRFRH